MTELIKKIPQDPNKLCLKSRSGLKQHKTKQGIIFSNNSTLSRVALTAGVNTKECLPGFPLLVVFGLWFWFQFFCVCVCMCIIN